MNAEGQPNPSTPPVTDKPQDKRKTVHLTRLSLTAPCPAVPGVESTLYWAVFDGNPRIVVKTNDPADQENYGKITAAMDTWDVGLFTQILARAITSEGPWKMKIDKKNKYKGKQTFDVPTHINDVIIGKNAEGVLYLMVYEQGRPEIMFPLLPSEYSTPINADGSPLPKAEVSRMFATSYSEMLIPTITSVVGSFAIERSNNPEPFEPRPQGGGYPKKQWQPNGGGQGGGGNGYQQRQGGGQQGGYQKKPWQGNNNGGGQGGSGYQNNRQGGGGNGYQQRPQGGGQGGYQNNNQNQSRPPAVDKPVDIQDADLPF